MSDSKNKIKLFEERHVRAVWDEERDRLTQEALADVDAGCVIDNQEVQAWAESLGADNRSFLLGHFALDLQLKSGIIP